MRPLGIRTRLLAAIAAAVALALAIGVAAFYLVLREELAHSARSLARGQAQAELATVRVVDGRVVAAEVPERGATGQLWVFEGTRAIEAPRVDAEVAAAARRLLTGPARSQRVDERVLLYAIPIEQSGVRRGTVISAVSLDPYESTERDAFIGSLLLAAAILAAVVLIARWMLGRALKPVAAMTENAAAWSEHDLSRRFAVGEPHDELTRLGATLDALLERISATLRHEQRFTAELSHELRTPLARAKGETELALRRERTGEEYRAALEAVHRNLDEIAATIESLLAAARHEAATVETGDIREMVERAVAAAAVDDGAMRVRLMAPDRPVAVAVEPDLLVSILRPLLENAHRYGRATVDVEVLADGGSAWVRVRDDGPGVDPDEVERIFEPGFRGSAGIAAGRGAGLGLPLAQRLAASVGGEILVEPSADGGSFSLRLPLGSPGGPSQPAAPEPAAPAVEASRR
jgi:signal transduction histidine kinase